MTNKYSTGKYMLMLFDVHGTKQKTLYQDSLQDADFLGRDLIANPPYASYVIVRVIKNSNDNAYPWKQQNV